MSEFITAHPLFSGFALFFTFIVANTLAENLKRSCKCSKSKGGN